MISKLFLAFSVGFVVISTAVNVVHSASVDGSEGAFGLPLEEIIREHGVPGAKLAVAGRLLGIVSEWYVKQYPDGLPAPGQKQKELKKAKRVGTRSRNAKQEKSEATRSVPLSTLRSTDPRGSDRILMRH